MSRLDDLKALRQTLLTAIDCVEPDRVAPLANQLRLCVREIAELEGEAKPSLSAVSPIERARLAREERKKA